MLITQTSTCESDFTKEKALSKIVFLAELKISNTSSDMTAQNLAPFHLGSISICNEGSTLLAYRL